MLEIKINQTNLSLKAEGDHVSTLYELAQVIYGVYTALYEDTGMPLDTFLKGLNDTTKNVPKAYAYKTEKREYEEREIPFIDATGVKQ